MRGRALSVIGLIISVVSLSISYFQYDNSKQALKLQKKPNLLLFLSMEKGAYPSEGMLQFGIVNAGGIINSYKRPEVALYSILDVRKAGHSTPCDLLPTQSSYLNFIDALPPSALQGEKDFSILPYSIKAIPSNQSNEFLKQFNGKTSAVAKHEYMEIRIAYKDAQEEVRTAFWAIDLNLAPFINLRGQQYLGASYDGDKDFNRIQPVLFSEKEISETLLTSLASCNPKADKAVPDNEHFKNARDIYLKMLTM